MNCVDRPWPRDPQAYVDLAARLAATAPRFGPATCCAGLPCATWPVLPSAAAARGAGAPARRRSSCRDDRDPATPYAWAVALADQLPQGVLLTHDGDGHTVYRAGRAGLRARPGGRLPGHGPAPLRHAADRRARGPRAPGWLCPRQDSNLRFCLRRAALYPLSYGGSGRRRR